MYECVRKLWIWWASVWGCGLVCFVEDLSVVVVVLAAAVVVATAAAAAVVVVVAAAAVVVMLMSSGQPVAAGACVRAWLSWP
jgi:hypothetical protein